MTITRIICLISIAAFSLLAVETPAYADNFGSDPNGDYYLWGPLWAEGPQANPQEMPLNEIIGAWLSEEWYFGGFGTNDIPTFVPPSLDGPESDETSFESIFSPLVLGPSEPGNPESAWTGDVGSNAYSGGTLLQFESVTTPPVVTPEPGSLLLLGTGLAGLGLLRHRLNRRQKSAAVAD